MKGYVNITNRETEKGHGGVGDHTSLAFLMCNKNLKWHYIEKSRKCAKDV